jgi:hypothetical protein
MEENEDERPSIWRDEQVMFVDVEGRRVAVSLGWDDVWVECCQYLGIVLRDADRKEAEGRIATAISKVRRKLKVPNNIGLTLGNLERDLARLKLRSKVVAYREIEGLLRETQADLEGAGDKTMLAATFITWAALHERRAREAGDEDRGTWRRELQAMEEMIEKACTVAESELSPMLETIIWIEATALSLRQGLVLDQERLRRAAQHCLLFGFGGQARELLQLPGVAQMLPEELYSGLVRSYGS